MSDIYISGKFGTFLNFLYGLKPDVPMIERRQLYFFPCGKLICLTCYFLVKYKNMRKILLLVISIILVAGFVYFLNNLDQIKTAKAGSGDNVSGWAWSENIGWISFNCINQGTCGTVNYGVNIDTNGKFSGYTWSENIGWLTFNESQLTGCPSTPCWAKVSLGNGEVSGWARALAYGDGWDGWLRLRGTNYGVSWNSSTKELEGWAWSDGVIGWLSFNCKNQNVCGTSNYKVVANLTTAPSATNLLVDPPNSADYCGVTGYPRVRVRWQFSDPGDNQSAYQIQIDNNSDFSSPEVDTGKVISASQSFLVQPPYPTLSWNQTYYWRIKVWDSQNTPSAGWIVYQDDVNPPESFTTPSHSYPYPDFTPSPQNPSIGEIVTFNNNSICYGSCSYLWDFGNGQTSATAGNATTTYTIAGPKIVILTITDNGLSPAGSCATSRQVNIGARLPKWREILPF